MSTTVIERHGNTLRITVELGMPEKAEKAMAILADMIAENGPERVRITFENVALVPMIGRAA